MISSSIRYLCRIAFTVLLVMATACGTRPAARRLTVAAAADLNFAMEEMSRRFHAAHPEVELQVAYGSSGSFFAQIRAGGPFDLFFSADLEYPRKLTAEAIGTQDSVFTYPVGPLVVWVPANSPLDPATA